MRPLRLIVNPSAGGGRTARSLPEVQTRLSELGLTARTDTTTSIEHAHELAREAAAAGEVAVSFGGDGLAGAVAHALRGTDGVLGVLPGGRGNDFVRKLGIPGDPTSACDVLAHGRERVVDVAEVDGRTFVGVASYGFDSDVQDLANASRVRGQLVYLYSTLRELVRWRLVQFSFTADGEPRRDFRGWSLAACNSGMFGGGMAVAPDADLEDGLLDVVINGALSKPAAVRGVVRSFKGTHLKDPLIELLRTPELRVDAERPFRIYADGDPIGETPATIRVVPRALKVLVP